mgnify:CR=1 FL=1
MSEQRYKVGDRIRVVSGWYEHGATGTVIESPDGREDACGLVWFAPDIVKTFERICYWPEAMIILAEDTQVGDAAEPAPEPTCCESGPAIDVCDCSSDWIGGKVTYTVTGVVDDCLLMERDKRPANPPSTLEQSYSFDSDTYTIGGVSVMASADRDAITLHIGDRELSEAEVSQLLRAIETVMEQVRKVREVMQ